MKKILSLLFAFALIISLSSFTQEDGPTNNCKTVQTITITRNNDCPIGFKIDGVDSYSHYSGGPITFDVGPLSKVTVCVFAGKYGDPCDIDVTINHSMVEVCETKFGTQTSYICASTKTITINADSGIEVCKTFSCLTPEFN